MKMLCVNSEKEIIIALKLFRFSLVVFITVCGGNNAAMLQIRICPSIFLANNL